VIALLKAIPFGIFLTLLVCLFVGSSGSNGGLLVIHSFDVMDIRLFWSWRLFLGGTGLTWALLLLMSD